MNLTANKVQGTLLKRYKRFLADVQLESGEVIAAYCCNTGKLLGVPENATILLTDHGVDTKRKLRYTWEYFKDEETWVGINTNDANTIVHKLLISKQIPGLEEYQNIRREVKYGQNSRVDFLLENADQRLYLEVKSVHMRRGTTAMFPDCPTERGAKHMWELSQIINPTTKAAVLYLVQRDDCEAFAIASDLDPIYAIASNTAKKYGVEMMAASLTLKVGKAPCFQKMLTIL
ncbi:MAG: DNA/RNA nuclease SfsA [Candidatus Paracaedibacteraceae bacterium]|nr:DNA/RNA nuclease SfsA [Candidatus Paracaedibacteraceae bacterium]